jgi:hypothetical protein
MSNPRIYADFNGLQNSVSSEGKVALYLHTLGSLMDLSRLKLCLRDGLQLDVYSDSDAYEDLEATGIVHFDHSAKQWFVEFDEQDIRDVPTRHEPIGAKFPCWNCGAELHERIWASGLKLGDACQRCGREIHEPLRAP